MAQWRSPLCLMNSLDWVKVHWEPYSDRWFFVTEHRNVSLTESMFYHEAIDPRQVFDFLFQLKKEIDYYLDAIWC